MRLLLLMASTQTSYQPQVNILSSLAEDNLTSLCQIVEQLSSQCIDHLVDVVLYYHYCVYPNQITHRHSIVNHCSHLWKPVALWLVIILAFLHLVHQSVLLLWVRSPYLINTLNRSLVVNSYLYLFYIYQSEKDIYKNKLKIFNI